MSMCMYVLLLFKCSYVPIRNFLVCAPVKMTASEPKGVCVTKTYIYRIKITDGRHIKMKCIIAHTSDQT